MKDQITTQSEIAKVAKPTEVVYQSHEDQLLQLLRAGFKLGAVFGFKAAKTKQQRTLKGLIKWLESPEAQTMINSIVKDA